MEIKKIGDRGTLFTFEYGDSVYLINTKDTLFLCDTNEGSEPMSHVKKYITENQLDHKEFFIFNSHSDWDHVWGNDAFNEATIIGHKFCKSRMEEIGEYQLEVLSEYHDGSIELVFPNLTFSNTLKFENEQIEFIHAPGHTIDSAICIDRKDSVVYAGDLVEYPIPVLNHYDLKQYLETLNYLKELSIDTIVATHSGVVNIGLINENINYIEAVLNKNPIEFRDEMTSKIHSYNMKNILILRYEDMIREKLGERFDFKTYKRDFWTLLNSRYGNPTNEFWNIRNISYENIKEMLEAYIARL